MANTKQGIYYQDDYSSVADVPSDMKKMAESIDTELENDRGRLSKNETDITEIKAKNTVQDTSIEELTQRLNEKENQIAELEDKVSDLNNNQIHGKSSGEYVHLSDSAKMKCGIAVLGNSKQETGDVTDEEGNVIGTMPSLDYPSEIESVESSANVKVWNKNWFSTNVTNKSISSSNVKSTEIENGVRISYSGSTSSTYLGYIYIIKDIRNYVGKTLAVSAKAKASASNNTRMNLVLCDENGGNRKVLKSSDLSNVEINATIPETEGDVHYLGIVFYANVDGTIAKDDYVDYTDIQVEEDAITDYISHEEQNYPVDMQEPFRAINDVRDCFVLKEDGKWYERHKITEYVFDGTENFQLQSDGRFGLNIPTAKKESINIKNQMCSHLALSPKWAAEENTFIVRGKYIYVNIPRFTTVDEFKTFLEEQYNAGTSFTIEYELLEPLDIECTEQQTQQLKALLKAKTYKNITNITTDTIAVLDVDYKRDLETIINNINTAVVALGGV